VREGKKTTHQGLNPFLIFFIHFEVDEDLKGHQTGKAEDNENQT
jgi:hypothetical protein